MSTITLQEAQSNLAELVHRLAPGEGVTITENDRPIARLIVPLVAPAHPPRPRPPVTGVPKAGSCEGLFVVPDDFKEPLEEMREYME
jgi:antitoxin (DNA-binding transcriptional repressor) of toxin-antitoxin stability system